VAIACAAHIMNTSPGHAAHRLCQQAQFSLKSRVDITYIPRSAVCTEGPANVRILHDQDAILAKNSATITFSASQSPAIFLDR
jgi:hypothetical protein